MIFRLFRSLLRLPFFVLIFWSCEQDFEEPEITLDGYQIEAGFELKVVASEPFLEAPVAIDFDNSGRIWAVEMRGYMQSLSGEGETLPNGVISILEDKDGDGKVDHSKVFMEGLVLPRAIAHVYGGLLYAEPPNLWFVEIDDDRPGKKILVDSLYATDGNVEHQSNGLMMNIDNWIYNARSHFRYRRLAGQWLKEPTSFRGQWGISKDNFGRLYYNDNSTQIAGDYVLPNVHTKNEFFEPKAGIGHKLTDNQRVYPLHATLVNRGYQAGVLDGDSMLVNVTSACGPLVYRGGQFPASHNQNAFVCVPEANLVKRNLLTFNGPMTFAKQAWNDREFLASLDEGFRPVNLSHGPDGAMYIVDMHRGIIQHSAYMTSYLRERIADRGLDTVIGMGRILKVVHSEQTTAVFPNLLSADTRELVNLLQHPNGWVRDRAQQLLIDQNLPGTMKLLNELVSGGSSGIEILHTLYVAEGLGKIDHPFLLKLLGNSNPEIVAHALLMARKYEVAIGDPAIQSIVHQGHPTLDLYLLTYLGAQVLDSGPEALPLIGLVLDRNSGPIYQEALLSSLGGAEQEWLQFISKGNLKPNMELLESTKGIIANRREGKRHWIHDQAYLPPDDRTHGLQLFREICTACHGSVGQGVNGLAPPLINSEYILSARRLGLVLLHGMKGPLHVNGVRYEFNAQMPGLTSNKSMTDQDIADLMVYLSNAFGNSDLEATPELVKELRNLKPDEGVYSESELLEITK